jgi:orotidine-5'-phosphate decarboxylase
LAIPTARDCLIVALDFPDVELAGALVERLGPSITFYKIGLELAMGGGLHLARRLSDTGKRVFLDIKLLDIGNTVERATRAAAATGATFLTVHAHDTKTLRAAVAGADGTGLRLLGVTVLTNLDGDDLREQGIAEPSTDLVVRRARLARAAGCDGIVATPQAAIAAGANHLVVGRPITRAADPRRAAAEFLQAIEEALAVRGA